MRWRDGRRSTNIEDRRGTRGTRGRGGRRVALGGGSIIILALIAAFLGADPQEVLQVAEQAQRTQGGGLPSGAQGQVPPGQEELVDFMSVILADTEDTWRVLLARETSGYAPPTLVLFSDSVESACGHASSAVGPFYCPGDRKVYLDLTFFEDLDRRFGAPGDFAQAYVLAHEIGHHVQELLGVFDETERLRRHLSPRQRNTLTVMQELQADCLAGVWAHHAATARNRLERGDVEEGLAAATAIGDDTLQRRGGGRVQPETWTHGSAAMRGRWFTRGLDSGDVAACDTFNADEL